MTPPNDTPTPRSDSESMFAYEFDRLTKVVPTDCARTLERDLDAANEKLATLKHQRISEVTPSHLMDYAKAQRERDEANVRATTAEASRDKMSVALSQAISVAEDGLDYRPDDIEAEQWAEIKSALASIAPPAHTQGGQADE